VEGVGTSFDVLLKTARREWYWIYNLSLGKGMTEHRMQVSPHSDVFIEGFDPYRTEMWDIIREMRTLKPWLKFLILTKRPHNVPSRLPPDWGNGWDNVWLGVSAENQKWADTRISSILKVPSKEYFVSACPLLEPVTLSKFLVTGKINFIMAGCESGPMSRTTDLSWLESIRKEVEYFGGCFVLVQYRGPDGKLVKGHHYDSHCTHKKGSTSSDGRKGLRKKLGLKIYRP
jgi:protein gp37